MKRHHCINMHLGKMYYIFLLYDHIKTLVFAEMKRRSIDPIADPVAEREVWAEIADEQWADNYGSGSTLDLEIQSQCGNRQKINPNGHGG